VLLELCIASVEDARIAQAGGADRLELNVALAQGGLTPSLGLLEEVKNAVTLPVMVMVRPRGGGFCYRDDEFRVMVRDARHALSGSADGIVFGILTEDGRVDGLRCRQFLDEVQPSVAVFHRAFDVTVDPFAALEELVSLGFHRVMTSGQEESAYQGAALIAQLIAQAAGRIDVLPAGGINRFTIADVLARTGCEQIHCSLRSARLDPSMSARPQVSFGGPVRVPEDRYDGTDAAALADMRSRLRDPAQ
jgi:copper homeostasis protein